MRVMVLVKASKDAESGAMPIREKMAEMENSTMNWFKQEN